MTTPQTGSISLVDRFAVFHARMTRCKLYMMQAPDYCLHVRLALNETGKQLESRVIVWKSVLHAIDQGNKFLKLSSYRSYAIIPCTKTAWIEYA